MIVTAARQRCLDVHRQRIVTVRRVNTRCWRRVVIVIVVIRPVVIPRVVKRGITKADANRCAVVVMVMVKITVMKIVMVVPVMMMICEQRRREKRGGQKGAKPNETFHAL